MSDGVSITTITTAKCDKPKSVQEIISVVNIKSGTLYRSNGFFNEQCSIVTLIPCGYSRVYCQMRWCEELQIWTLVLRNGRKPFSEHFCCELYVRVTRDKVFKHDLQLMR